MNIVKAQSKQKECVYSEIEEEKRVYIQKKRFSLKELLKKVIPKFQQTIRITCLGSSNDYSVSIPIVNGYLSNLHAV